MVQDEQATFADELKRWRTLRGLSRSTLARKLAVDPSYISHLESGREHGSAKLARSADTELNAAGALWKAWQPNDSSPMAGTDSAGESALTSELLVLDDDAALSFDGQLYRLRMRRRLRNTGTEPVTRYLVRIAVDRHPSDPERSNTLYRAHPLTWPELALTAACASEPMNWTVKHDRDAVKEIWLEFANSETRFPLYPGQETDITYSYHVGANKWGPWFQRAVRLPTRHLSVELAFPAEAEPTVWGTETTLTTQSPLRTPPARTDRDGLAVFTWSTLDPPLHARYRLEWRLKTEDGADVEPIPLALASTVMAAAGIIQDTDATLTEVARPFDLPTDANEARQVIKQLLDAAERVRGLHTFGKGMGIAAPQIGIPRAAAIIIPPEPDADPVAILNPRITESSSATDEQYEGCLSFFDVRGLVPRSLKIIVAHIELDGSTHLTGFEYGMARLVAHEVDHLYGILYRARMQPGNAPISVEQYRGTGTTWQYH